MIKNVFLGLGPMSLEIINSIDNFSKINNRKIMLICSRNQIETSLLGGGYVSNFSTKNFAEFIKNKKNKNLIMCRDHAGPYRNDRFNQNLSNEITDCKLSLSDDIKNDFKIIHIDTSQCKKKYEIAEELISFCQQEAKKLKKKIYFEFGCEEHGVLKNLNQFKKDIIFFSKFKNKKFIVCQTGSHVKSTFQVGQFDFDGVKKMKKFASNYGILLKEHNGDYLNKYQIKIRKKFGIDALNVAPELGYIQSNFILIKAKEYSLNKEINKFIKYVLKKKKWKKWNYNKENDYIKFLCSAHYFYNSDEYKNLKRQLIKYTSFQSELNEIISDTLNKFY